MESITFHGSPLATEYEEHSQDDLMVHPHPESDSGSTKSESPTFAPRGPSGLRLRCLNLPQPVRVATPRLPPLDDVRNAFSHAVTASIGRTENARFLEHFRYIIIASHLLSEQTSQGGHISRNLPNAHDQSPSGAAEYVPVSITLTGVLITGVATFGLVWLIHWSRSQTGSLSKSKLSLTVLVIILSGLALRKYSQRQVLLYLRQETVSTTNSLITNLISFEVSNRTSLSLIQDVEVVSRGLQISEPMPPISRIEASGGPRHCLRLRHTVAKAFGQLIPPMLEACNTMRQLVKEDHLERYLGIYEITNADLQDAAPGYSEGEFEEPETLEALRILRRRFSVLRRVFLCSLLALEADGTQSDLARWRAVVTLANQLATLLGLQAQQVQKVLNEEELPTSPRSSVQPIPLSRKRAFSQARKLSTLSRGVRDLQGKVQLLREESTRLLEMETSAEEVSELSKGLMSQYDSLGQDLRSLMHAWEQGKTSLAISISRTERRVSQRSSGLRSPATSLGGLTAVEDSEGSPSDALRVLNGELVPKSRRSSTSATEGSREDYEEVYEAIALPRVRQSLNREERLAKVQEEQALQAQAREQRIAEDSLIKELTNVISRKPEKPATTA